MQLCVSCGFLLIPCELGTRMSNSFIEITHEIEQLNWYLFPIEAQKILPIIVIIVQEPVMIQCFGSISCARETFKNVSQPNQLIYINNLSTFDINFNIRELSIDYL